MQYTSQCGFLPTNTPEDNQRIFQTILDKRGTIVVDEPGIYDIVGTLFIDDDTTIEFCAGSYIRRISSENGNDALFLNRGALTKTYNHDITIRGLRLICNGVDINAHCVLGMNCHIGFFYTKHTVIEDFQCMDLLKRGFCIQICTFEDSRIENIHVEGDKDAVHYGPGHRFILRNGVFRTYDDPIALNANDYAVANPEMGWIEDGLIEFCYDLDQPQTTGFFCRLLGGAWLDWKPGMIIRNSDTVVSNGRMYRATLPPDGKEYISNTQPTHVNGKAELDGIVWAMTQDQNVVYNCGCRNIHFKDIFLQKHRARAFAFHFDNDNYSHSYYPYANAPIQDNIVLENVYVQSEVPQLVGSTTPIGSLKVINCLLNNTSIRVADRGVPGIVYPPVNLTLSGCTIRGEVNIVAAEGKEINLKSIGNQEDSNSKLNLVGNVQML
ncbi:MAG: hypothetical protein MJ236_01835 [Clostridia bacterium]|nr:hypothetical protein [Clostridia bacterium]